MGILLLCRRILELAYDAKLLIEDHGKEEEEEEDEKEPRKNNDEIQIDLVFSQHWCHCKLQCRAFMIHRGWSSSQATCEKETTDTENHTETVPMGEELHHAMPGDYYLTKAFYSVQSHRNQHVRRSVGEKLCHAT